MIAHTHESARKLTFAIGDIHGRMDLLLKAIDAINAYGQVHHLIFLGDYIDKGPNSPAVVDLLMEMSEYPNVTCLAGNHEDIFIRAVLDADPHQWINNGGDKTLQQYTTPAGKTNFTLMRKHATWMKGLKTWTSDAHRIFVHGGIEPNTPMTDQNRHTLLWTRKRSFLDAPRNELASYVVHGHTPSHDTKSLERAEITSARTNIDTAAFLTGILTVAVFNDLQPAPIDLIQVKMDSPSRVGHLQEN